MNRKGNQRVIPLIFIVLLTATFVLGCSILKSDKKLQNKNKVIELEVTDAEDSDYIEEQELFFIPNQDGFVYLLYGSQLHTFYRKMYAHKYPDYQSFKMSILNDSIVPPLPRRMKLPDCECYLGEKFSEDSVVKSFFSHYSLDAFIEKYCFIMDNNRLGFLDDKSYNKRMTVAYCLWQRGYDFIHGGNPGGDWLERNGKCNPFKNLQKQEDNE